MPSNNVIPDRIQDFLKHYPPFNLIQPQALARLSERVFIEYHEKDSVIFKQGDALKDQIFVVRQGAVEIVRQQDGQDALLDVCDEGEMFGVRPLLADEPYLASAIVREDAILYAIKLEEMRALIEQNPNLAVYLASVFAANVGRAISQSYSTNMKPAENQALIELVSARNAKKPVTCPPDSSVQAAAMHMRQQRVGSIIVVDDKMCPLGILTDTDLRNKIATGDMPISSPVADMMSKPVITVAKHVTLAESLLQMLRYKVHHLCVTEDGSVNSAVVGVVSEHDLMLLQGSSPALILREMLSCTRRDELASLRTRAEKLVMGYIEQEVSIEFVAGVISEINDAMIHKAIELAQDYLEQEMDLAKPEVAFCWLSLGSEGREEQLLRTDQDNALLYADVPEADAASVKAYFLQLAQHVNDTLHACGFVYCPADMMARNPSWCLSLAEWQQQFKRWIQTPDEKAVLYSTIFFDYRPVYGDFKLAEALTTSIYQHLQAEGLFLPILAKNALTNPAPLSFFRNFVVERSGEHKNEFDIKSRAMMPLADAARVLSLHHKVSGINSTIKRYKKLAELEPNNAALFEEAAMAYEILMRFRATDGFKHQDSGRFIQPEALNKIERLSLKSAFKPIEDLQGLLKTRFQLSYLR